MLDSIVESDRSQADGGTPAGMQRNQALPGLYFTGRANKAPAMSSFHHDVDENLAIPAGWTIELSTGDATRSECRSRAPAISRHRAVCLLRAGARSAPFAAMLRTTAMSDTQLSPDVDYGNIINHLSHAASGPGGLVGAFKEVAAGITKFEPIIGRSASKGQPVL
jgi:hypothetical protein